MTNADLVRQCYRAYETQDRALIEAVLADDFHFSSPRDDNIDRAAYFERCWPNAGRLEAFDLERIVEQGDEAFVRYVARRVADGGRFRNVEVFRFRAGRIIAVDVYFGRDL